MLHPSSSMLKALCREHEQLRADLKALKRCLPARGRRKAKVDKQDLLALLEPLPCVSDLMVKGRRRRLFALTRNRCPSIGAVLDRAAHNLASMDRLRELAELALRADLVIEDVVPQLRLIEFVDGTLGQLSVLDDYILPVASHYLLLEDWVELAHLDELPNPPGHV